MARRLFCFVLSALYLSCPTTQAPCPATDLPDAPSDAPPDLLPPPKTVVFGFCEANDQPFPVRPPVTEPATLPFLEVQGTDIVDDKGNRVALRGVNFGSWLQMEVWIPGIGLLGEGEILAMIPAKAAGCGVEALIAEARASNALPWLIEERSHWVLIQEWRAYSYAHATPAQLAGLDCFWGWFDSEPWIFEERNLWKWFAKRFGWEGSDALRKQFQDHWITELDVQRVADLGMNLIRVPIWFDALETDDAGGAAFRPEGWARLDGLGRWARKYGVYLMLDLHGAPGGQSTSWHQGLEDGGHLWTDDRCLWKTARLWKAIASYFAGDPHVAVLDLLNEPMAVKDAERYAAVHDAIYRAIREVDPGHIVMIEDGYRAPDVVVSPKAMGWTNAMFSIHLYPDGANADAWTKAIEDGVTSVAGLFKYMDAFGCPLFLGEFNAADGAGVEPWSPQAMDKALGMLNQRGVHWAPWTWKFLWGGDTWGVYHPAKDYGKHIDVKDAGFEQIMKDFAALDSANYVPLESYAAALKKRAVESVKPLDLTLK